MARPVELVDVERCLEEYGPVATLVTVTTDGKPHLGTVLVTAGQDELSVRVGGRTREIVESNPAVSLAWIRDDSDYQMIVDGTATIGGVDAEGLHVVAVRVERGILHRVAGRRGRPLLRAAAIRFGCVSHRVRWLRADAAPSGDSDSD